MLPLHRLEDRRPSIVYEEDIAVSVARRPSFSMTVRITTDEDGDDESAGSGAPKESDAKPKRHSLEGAAALMAASASASGATEEVSDKPGELMEDEVIDFSRRSSRDSDESCR